MTTKGEAAMNANGKCEVVRQFARRGLALAALLAVALFGAGVTRAQSGAAAVPTSAVKPAAALAKTTASPVAKPSAKGSHEGIRVHGYWTIVVKNPDGSIATRREFENSIQSAGEAYLASLLAGSNSPGGLSILLNGAGTAFTPPTVTTVLGVPVTNPEKISFTEGGPCQVGASFGAIGLISVIDPPAGTTCLITAAVYPGTSTQTLLGSVCAALNSSGGLPACSTNLTASGPAYAAAGLTSSSLQVAFGGSTPVSATIAGQVNDVETMFIACDPTVAPNACNVANGAGIFTEKVLDGVGGDPAAVPYSPGQTIGVTLTISFN
jgi:hypothetical protein